MKNKKQLSSVLICRTPKTYIILDKSLPEAERQRRIKRYFDKQGGFKIDTVKDHKIFGIK